MLKASWQKHILRFRFEAGTSRGILTTKDTWFLKIWDNSAPGIFGLGECGPLKGLSPDDTPAIEDKLDTLCKAITSFDFTNFTGQTLLEYFSLHQYPSVLFGLETALLDLASGGKRMIYDTPFFHGKDSIPINGLIWMGNERFMKEQIEDKLSQGYTCIKLKIGAIDFDKEIKMIESIRKRFSAKQITIRVDANGAFNIEDAMEKLKTLSRYELHSIEQPIKAGHPDAMRELCVNAPIAIALDEELTGIKNLEEKINLLEQIRPQYIILKPTLTGGLYMSKEWIQVAEQRQIGWWITSALESNIGLNAISQFTSLLFTSIPQGLGTGQLYHNNISSPLTIEKGMLSYDPSLEWDLNIFS